MVSELNKVLARGFEKPTLVVMGLAAPLLAYVAWCLTAYPLFLPGSTLVLTATCIAIICFLWNIFADIVQCVIMRDRLGLTGWLLVLAILVSIIVQATNVPLAAWDALGGEWGVHSYAEQAVRIVDPDFGGDTARSPRHPPLVPYFLMVGSTLSELTGSVISAGALGALLSLGIPVSFICAFGLRLNKVSLSPLLCMCFLSLPLLENHVTVFGYPEVFVWALTQILFLTLYLRLNSVTGRGCSRLLEALLVTVLLLLTKSLAIIFVFSAWAAYVLSAVSIGSLTKFAVGAMVVSGVSALLLEEYGLSYLLPTISEDGSAIYANFSGRLSQVNIANLLPSVSAIGLGLFVNGSFSVLPTMSLLIMFGCLTYSRSLFRSTIYLVLLQISISVAFTLAGSIDYVANNSDWGSDTLLSRSMLPFLAVSPLIFLNAVTCLTAIPPILTRQNKQ